MKNILGIMLLALVSNAAKAQINLGKATKVPSQGVAALSFSNEAAQKLAKEGVAWMDHNNEVAGTEDPYTIRL